MPRPSLAALAAPGGLAALALALAPAAASAATDASPVTLTIFAAGTLAAPFKKIDAAFMKQYPNVKIEAQFGGSVKMVKQVTELHQVADVVAVADYSVIPKYLYAAKDADWYAGFVTNAITFVYTDHSKFAGEVTPANWYQVLARPGVQIGRSNPDTDPSGYQTVQMLDLAGKYYKKPGLADAVLANAPKTNMRNTETELVGALESGQIDYLAIYRSDARQHKFKYLELPPQIDLSDARYSSFYAQGSVHTANGLLTAKPIVYAVTIPHSAAHADWATRYLQYLLGPEGQRVMAASGFGTLPKALASDPDKVPAQLQPLTTPWPN